MASDDVLRFELIDVGGDVGAVDIEDRRDVGESGKFADQNGAVFLFDPKFLSQGEEKVVNFVAGTLTIGGEDLLQQNSVAGGDKLGKFADVVGVCL